MKKLKLLSTVLMVSLLLALFAVPASALEDPNPEASTVFLIDMATGNALYGKNEDAQVAPASLTKIMTVMLAVEAIELGNVSQTDKVTSSESMTTGLQDDGSTAGIKVGETMSLEDLLYCAMVKSANEACNIIAEYIAGSIGDFVARMNARAAELGCTGTNFVNPHGLPAANHYTTARDMALIARAAVAHPLFAEICNTPSITIPATNMSEARVLENTNGLINAASETYPGYFYEYASGIKTGYTDAAGYCLISTAKKNGVNLLLVVMGGKATHVADGTRYGNFTDSINMYNWAFENFSYRDILKVTDLVKDIPVSMGEEADFVSVHPNNAVRMLLPNDDDLQGFVQKTRIYSEETGEELVAPIEAGQILGEITIENDGVVYGSSLLAASSSIGLNYSRFISNRISETLKKPIVIIFIIVILALLIAYIFLVVRYHRSRKKFAPVSKAPVSAAQQLNSVKKSPTSKLKSALSQEPKNKMKFFDIPLDDEGVKVKPEPEIKKPELTPEEQAERDYFAEFFGDKK